jgi:hypothetical protein
MASNRAFVRGELLCALSDLPRVVLLSTRIPHAMQSVPMLVRDHLEEGVIDSAGLGGLAARNALSQSRFDNRLRRWHGRNQAPYGG